MHNELDWRMHSARSINYSLLAMGGQRGQRGHGGYGELGAFHERVGRVHR